MDLLVLALRWHEMRRVLRGRWTPNLEQLRWYDLSLPEAIGWKGLLRVLAWTLSRPPQFDAQGRRLLYPPNGERGLQPLAHFSDHERHVLSHPLFESWGRPHPASRPRPDDLIYDLLRQPRLVWRHCKYLRPWLSDGGHSRIRPKLERLYRTVNSWLRELEVDYWLDWGTLLGFHREGDIIPGDYDVDFSALARDYPKIVAARHRLPADMKVCDASYRYCSPKLYVCLEDWKVDLYFQQERGSELECWGDTDYPCSFEPTRKELIFPLQKADFLGEPTFVPARVYEHLIHRYGCLDPDAVRDPTLNGRYRPRSG